MSFKDKIKVELGDMKDIPVYLNKEHNQGKKVALKRLRRLVAQQMAYVQENNSFDINEKTEQMTVFFRMDKILANYDELEPVLQKYFAEKAEKERFNR